MTPLTVLQGHLAALPDDPAPGARIRAAMDEVHYLAALVHNLALAAALEAGEPDLSRAPIDLNALLERVAARHLPIATAHHIALEHATPEAPLHAHGDVTLIEQAVSNLVLNAIQHAGPRCRVAVALDRRPPGRFAITIADDGPGMSGHLLDRGRRGNGARTRSPTGRGLGLDIAHRVIRLHDWSLTLANTEPHGLSVTIAGPLDA